MPAERLWALSPREFRALTRQWELSREFQMGLVAAIRADLHNTSAREYQTHFTPQHFLPGGAAKIQQTQTAEDKLAIVQVWNTVLGQQIKKVKRERPDAIQVDDAAKQRWAQIKAMAAQKAAANGG